MRTKLRSLREKAYHNEMTATNYEAGQLQELDKLLSQPYYFSEMFEVAGLLGAIKPSSVIDYDPRMNESLLNLGFSSVLFESTDGGVVDSAAVSRNPEIAQRMAEMFTRKEMTDDDHREIGKLLGYPETSTEYFIKRKKSLGEPGGWLPMIEPKHLEGTVTSEFHQLILSPDNWREEVENFILPIEQTASRLLPEAYRNMRRKVWFEKQLSRRALKTVGVEPPSPFEDVVGFRIEYVE